MEGSCLYINDKHHERDKNQKQKTSINGKLAAKGRE